MSIHLEVYWHSSHKLKCLAKASQKKKQMQISFHIRAKAWKRAQENQGNGIDGRRGEQSRWMFGPGPDQEQGNDSNSI